MKALKVSLVIVAAVVMIIGFSGYAGAFHSGGVAECTGCHSMHSANQAGGQGSAYLLIGSDQSSTCLNCHQNSADTGPSSYHISTIDSKLTGTAPLQRTPGGDFAWLKKSFTMTIRNATTTEAGSSHGHNIIAADYGYVADSTNTVAPGGTMSSSNLGCHSCHDPHGKFRRLSTGVIATTGAPIIASGSYHNSVDPAAGQAVGVYRLLAGGGYSRGGSSFNPGLLPPTAVVHSTYNRSEATTQTRVAYGKGMSDWCASCHPNMHANSGRFVHPVNENLGGIANNYNQYIGSGNMTGTQASSYLSLVPYEENSTDYAALKALAATSGSASIAGPSAGAQVACISCHKAHASGFPEMTRWNNDGEFITYNGLWPGTDSTPSQPQFARGRLAAEMQGAYNDIPATKFATYQRSLCNKCHAQD
jgi:hypothetical protein